MSILHWKWYIDLVWEIAILCRLKLRSSRNFRDSVSWSECSWESNKELFETFIFHNSQTILRRWCVCIIQLWVFEEDVRSFQFRRWIFLNADLELYLIERSYSELLPIFTMKSLLGKISNPEEIDGQKGKKFIITRCERAM